ncbi:MAG TPA: NAD(P)/FAD-dependent oxidoreductase, partial [Candidatus Thermoplasmatota archaeon]
MERFDVAIVGAGPAGTSTAIELLERDPGRSVVLIEAIRRGNTLQEGAPGAGHSMCSGGLGRAMIEAIGWEIPREARMADIYRVILQTRQRTVEFSGDELGFEGPIAIVTNRKRFDDWLLGKAMALGAHYEPGVRVRSTARVASGGPARWRIDTHGGRTFAARALVGADGPESATAKAHLAAPPVPDDDMYLATEVYVQSSRFPKDAMLARFQTSRIMGYYWAFRAGEVVKVGCGSSRTSGKQVSHETAWWRQELADQYGDPGFTGRVVDRVGGRITCAAPLLTVADPSKEVAVVGEAARAVLASLGAGDATAVESGRALGRALAAG